MSDYINIKINNSRYVLRNKFSRLLIFNDNGTKETISNLNELTPQIREIIEDAIKTQEAPENYFEYSIINNTKNPNTVNSIVITNYIGTDVKNVIIPETINGCSVKALLSDAFANIEFVEGIFIPNTINELPERLCMDMSDLKYIQLPSHSVFINKQCFLNCEKLTTINLENAKTIGTLAFANCKSLANINLENTMSIESSAFINCTNLSEINLPNIVQLEDSIFKKCKNLKSIKFGDYLQNINDDTFAYCHNLSEVKLPNTLKNIGIGSFYQCKKLKKINFPETLNFIDLGAFFQSGLKGEITFPKSLTKIAGKAFYETDLNKVNISKNTKFQDNSFSLDALININFYDTIKSKIKNKFKHKER